MASGQSPGDPNIHLPQHWDWETRTSIPENCYKEQTQFQRTDLSVKSGNTPIKLGENLEHQNMENNNKLWSRAHLKIY